LLPKERLATATNVYHVGVCFAQAVSFLQLEIQMSPSGICTADLLLAGYLLTREMECAQLSPALLFTVDYTTQRFVGA